MNVSRASALSGLAPHLPEELKGSLGKPWQRRGRIEDEDARASALSGLAPHLPEELKGEVLQEALAAARGSRMKMPEPQR